MQHTESRPKIRAIITGATGMVGEGVLHACLNHPEVEAVLSVSRKPCGVQHPKLQEVLVRDFFDLQDLEPQLKGWNACYFCLGVSSVGLNEVQYESLTYDLTINFAQKVKQANADLTFCYVSGAGTDSSEEGRLAWARVKGRTENHLLRMGFKAAYMFRPGFILPGQGMKNTLGFYRYVNWLYPIGRLLAPGTFGTLTEIGQAMIHCTLKPFPKTVLEVRDIREAAQG